MSQPLISVVIPTCDRPEMLGACLGRLAPNIQSLAAGEYEVIVSDDGQDAAQSTLGLRFPWVRWVAGPRRGPAANRNHAARQARGAWLAFTDDDCVPDQAWLQAFRNAIGPACRVYEGRTTPSGRRTRLDMECPANEAGGYLWSCNFLIETELFRGLGGFDENFRYAAMEDVDLRWRIRDAGETVTFVDAAVVQHPWRLKRGRAHLRQAASSAAYFVSKHPAASKDYTIVAIGLGLARTLGSHLPRNVRAVGLRGAGRDVGLALYWGYCLMQALHWRRSKPGELRLMLTGPRQR